MNSTEFLKVTLCCFRADKYTCTNCGRKLCAWHSAGSPVSVNDDVVLVPVCLPQCDAEFWKLTAIQRDDLEAA